MTIGINKEVVSFNRFKQEYDLFKKSFRKQLFEEIDIDMHGLINEIFEE